MSARTAAEKLLVKPGASIWASHPGRLALVEPLPAGTATASSMASAAVALVFADDAASLRAVLDAQHEALGAPGVLWILYPKANRTDINRDSLWPIAAEHGLRPIGQVAVDDTWSALRFRPMKPGEAPITGGRD